MPGKLIAPKVSEIKDTGDFTTLVAEINDGFDMIKKAFDVLGMCFGYKVTVTVASASADTAVPHYLGVIPDAYAVVSSNLPCRVWKGDTTWTSTNIYIQADKAVELDLLVFVDTN